MPLYKKGCRAVDRTSAKKLHMQGYNTQFIANQLRIEPAIIEDVLSGNWDEKETEVAKRQQKLNAERLGAKKQEEADRIAQIAAAAAHAIQSAPALPKAVDEQALRAEIEAQVRAEMEAEKPKRKRRTKAEIEAESGEEAA